MVHVSQFYPCSQISLASELLYICELGKYLSKNYGEELSIDGVVLDNCLKKSPIWEYFRFCVSEKWVINVGNLGLDFDISIIHPLSIDNNKISNILVTEDRVEFNPNDASKRALDEEYKYKVPELFQVTFTKNDNAWLWESKIENNNKLSGHNVTHQRFVSLVAYVAVNRLKTGEPSYLGVSFNQELLLLHGSAPAYLISLMEETSCMDWCKLVFEDNVADSVKLQTGYLAWYHKGRDLGMLNRWYSGKEKLAYCNDVLDIKEGDIVMFYHRPKASKSNFIKSITSCNIARVDKLTSDTITLTKINTMKLRYQAEVDWNNYTTLVRSMYCGKLPYENLNTTKESYSLTDFGVGYMMHTELEFIVPLSECNDEVETLVSNGVREDKLILPQNEFIYWLLEDYNFKYNRERFVDKYLGGNPFRNYYFTVGKEDKLLND